MKRKSIKLTVCAVLISLTICACEKCYDCNCSTNTTFTDTDPADGIDWGFADNYSSTTEGSFCSSLREAKQDLENAEEEVRTTQSGPGYSAVTVQKCNCTED